jgi:pimeloyl-ACP methyl ester carboxylesterase
MTVAERLRIPIWREGRAALERRALARDPVLSGAGVVRGNGEPVMLVPGFLAGDLSLGVLARWLRDLGYRPTRARIRANIDCTERALRRLEVQLQHAAERHGRDVSIVGQSRGGTMARALAVRRPDLVRSIVCLGSPVVDQLDVHPLVRVQVRTVAALGTLGVPGLFSLGCTSRCCAQAVSDITAPFPADLPFTSIFSRSDGVVGWRSCLDPAARHVEVRSSHIGMAVNPEVFRAVAEALAGDARSQRLPRPAAAAA